MPGSVDEMIWKGVMALDSYFKHKVDAICISGATPDPKILLRSGKYL